MSVISTVQRLRAADDFARQGKTGRATKQKLPKLPRDRRPHTWWRKLLKLSLLGLLTGGVIAVAIFSYAWSTLALPPEAPLQQTSFVTDAQGNRLAEFSAGENRTPVELTDMPVVLREAVIATEDRSFYTHKGVDPRGLGRALYVDLKSGSNAQGGSTLTQQYVKKTYVGDDRTMVRKFKEAILAMKLEQKLSKDQILQRYLNAVYFGRGAYGVQAASQAYFGKPVAQLDLREASYLAGLLRAPELADATTNPDVANERRDLTLGSMVATGTVSEAQRQEISKIPVSTYVLPRNSRGAATANADKGTDYFVDYVRRILVTRYGEERVNSGGLRIKTTLDTNMQKRAYDSLYGYLKPGEPAAALVTLDQNGYIKAMVGGRDFKESQVNLAVGREGGGSGRQAGSTFKPFTLAAALENGVCYKENYQAPAKIIIKGADNGADWTVSNYADEASTTGYLDLVSATEHSVNTVYAQLNDEIGAQKTAQMAKAAGITSPIGNNVANVLGTTSVSPLEMADSYLTFSQEGVRVAPNPILEVKTPDGETLEKAKPVKTRAMNTNTARAVNMALQGVVTEGTGTKARAGFGNRPLAGKTGTTENSGDAWFVGYTPTLSTAIWMGYPDGSSHLMRNVKGVREVTGGTLPATMFSNYMSTVAPQDNKGFAKPEDCRPKNGRVFSDPTPQVPQSTTTIPYGFAADPRGATSDPQTTRDETEVEDEPQARPSQRNRGRVFADQTVGTTPNSATDKDEEETTVLPIR